MTKSLLTVEFAEHDNGGIAYWRVVAGEGETARFVVDTKRGKVIGAVIADVEKVPGGIDIETSRVVSPGGLFSEIV